MSFIAGFYIQTVLKFGTSFPVKKVYEDSKGYANLTIYDSQDEMKAKFTDQVVR